jgi:hypothetical protein
MEDIGSSLAEHNDDFVTITTSNPVDLLNRHLYEVGDRNREQVIGFGGRLDSARFRYVLGQRFDGHETLLAHALQHLLLAGVDRPVRPIGPLNHATACRLESTTSVVAIFTSEHRSLTSFMRNRS